MIKRLLTPGSILELAIRRCVRGKDTLSLFPLGPSLLPVVMFQHDKRLANRTPQNAVRWCGSVEAECLVHTIELTDRILFIHPSGFLNSTLVDENIGCHDVAEST